MKKQTGERETIDAILQRIQPVPALETSSGRPFEEVETSGEGSVAPLREPRQEIVRGIHLKVRVELGRSRMLLKDALQLVPGSVVDLEKLADDPVDLFVNDLLVARGEVLVVDDCFCVRITEVMPPESEEES